MWKMKDQLDSVLKGTKPLTTGVMSKNLQGMLLHDHKIVKCGVASECGSPLESAGAWQVWRQSR